MTNEQLFKEHWMWLAETGNQHPMDWPEFKQNGGDVDFPENCCFACENIKNEPDCSRCPVIGDYIPHVSCLKNTESYKSWYYATDVETRKTLAGQIARMEWRKK